MSWRQRARRIVRVTALGGVVLSLALALGVRTGLAQIDESMRKLGRHLVALSETGLESGRRVGLNGQAIGFRVTTTNQPPSAVLDFYEAWCRSEVLGSFDEALQVLGSVDETYAADDSWRDLTRRQDDGATGYVACIRSDVLDPETGEIVRRLSAFAETGNLADIGRFHYAYVEQVEDVSRVVAVWTDGDFYPFALFPEAGDAPGGDAPGIPRPPSGRRMVSAGEGGVPAQLTVYLEAKEDAKEIARFYRRELPRNRWRVLADNDTTMSEHTFVAERDGVVATVGILRDSGSTSVTIAQVASIQELP